MAHDNEEQIEINALCKEIESLLTADHLSDEQKLTFVREALKIIENDQ